MTEAGTAAPTTATIRRIAWETCERCAPDCKHRADARTCRTCNAVHCWHHCRARGSASDALRSAAAIWGPEGREQELRIDSEAPAYLCGGPWHGHWSLGERDAGGIPYYGTWARSTYGYSVTFEPRGRHLITVREPAGDGAFAEPAGERTAAVARIVIAAAARMIRASGHEAPPGTTAVEMDRALAAARARALVKGERNAETTPLRD